MKELGNIISNLGGEDGVKFEVSIDNTSLIKLGAIMGGIAIGSILMNHLLKSV